MKMTRTKIGLIIALFYLGIFMITALLAIFDKLGNMSSFFPGLLGFPWFLIFLPLKIESQIFAYFTVLIGTLINAGIISFLFKYFDKDKKSAKKQLFIRVKRLRLI